MGYWWINNDTLSAEMANVFNKPEELNINLIITQMFTSDDKREFNNYIQNFNVAKQFLNVTYKDNVDTTNLYDNFVVKKNHISKIHMYQDDKKRGEYTGMTKIPFVDTDYYLRNSPIK